MRSRYRVRLGDVHLDTIDKDLRILDVQHSEPTFEISEDKTANLDGYDYSDAYFQKTTVTVVFELHIYDIARRNAVCQLVNKWAAAGGTLRTNDRENQCLRWVRCEKYASITSAMKWTDPLTLVFSTTYNPYWQSTSDKTLTLTGKAPKGTLKMDGNTGEALVSVTAVANAKVTSFQIKVGNPTITDKTPALKLTGIAVEKNKSLVIDYVHGRILRVRVDGKSVMSKLDPSSPDVLSAMCGQNVSVAITANNKMTSTIKARGMWI